MRLERGKQAILIAVFCFFAASLSGQSGKNFKYRLDGNLNSIDLIQGTRGLTVNYSISEINIENISNENGNFFRIFIPDHIPSSDPGKPQTPVYARIITVPEGSGYSVRITDIKSTVIKPSSKKVYGLLFPAQESESKNSFQKKPEFKMDKALYSKKELISNDTVRIVSIGKVRNNNLASLQISPVRYNPHSNVIEVITSMKIFVDFQSAGPVKSIPSESVQFSEPLNRSALNYLPSDILNGYSNQPVGMLILTDTVFKKQIQPFVKWKTQKGFRVNVLYRGASLAGDTYLQLKDTISKIYKRSALNGIPPEYLLIIGNINRIPSFSTGGVYTDLYYGEFDGKGDYIPELMIGRLPVSDTTEVKTTLAKIIQYEKFQFDVSNQFHSNAIATAGSDAGYASYMNGHIKYAISNYLTTGNRIKEHHFYNSMSPSVLSASKDSIIKMVNNGTSFINYTGHGEINGWLHLNILTADTARFNNKDKYPFIISNACRTAQFYTPSSFGNRMVVSANKGAIGFIGCSTESYWDEDFYWAVGAGTPSADPVYETKGLGFYDRLFHTHSEPASEWYLTMGQITFAGNLSVSASTSSRKRYYWETYNLIGDPSILPIIGTPQVISTVLPDTLPNGLETWSLSLKPYSYIAVSDFDTLWDASFASASGSVSLELPRPENDSCLVVITGHNTKPVIKTIYFSEINKEFVNLSSVGINDVKGNNNGKADFGEMVYLNLKIKNLGHQDAKNLHATISSLSEWVAVRKDSAFVETIGAGSEIFISDELEIEISKNIPDKGIATLKLELHDSISEKYTNIDLTLHAPDLKIVNCKMNDSGSGNGDFIADPGETYQLIFSIQNDGSSDASGQFRVSSPNADFSIIEKDVKSGLIKSGEVTEIAINVKLSEFTPAGSFISVNSILDCTPFVLNRDFIFRVGKIRESFESETFNVFPWINNSPKPWIIAETDPVDGNITARSGDISHNGKSTLVMRSFYDSADSIKFFYKVSSEKNYDFLIFKLNDVELLRKSGETQWEQKIIPVNAGYNKMEWIFSMDASTLGGSNCAWIDLIDFAGKSSVRYIQRDINVARIVTPIIKNRYGQGVLTVKVLNMGKDTIDNFKLAYMVDNQYVMSTQSFDKRLIPYGDTVTVSFTSKVDMSKLGIYDIKAFGTDNHDDYTLNDTVRIKIENTEMADSLVIFPNPFNDKLNIFINSRVSDKLNISITNSVGGVLYSVEKDILNGKNTILLNNIRLSPSIYYLNIKGSSVNRTIRILKMK